MTLQEMSREGSMSPVANDLTKVLTRPAVVRDSAHEVIVSLPVTIWQASQHSVQSFNTARLTSEPVNSSAHLVAVFMKFLSNQKQESHTIDLLSIFFEHFVTTYLDSNDVHSSGLEQEEFADVVSSLLLVQNELKKAGIESSYNPQSKLISSARNGDINLSLVFGGQGYSYMSELSTLYHTYKPIIHDTLVELVTELQQDVSSVEAVQSSLVLHGVDVLEWLKGDDKMPSEDYLISAPISMPLIGLTQLTQYAVLLKSMNLAPEDLRSISKNSTGHSQGVLAAVVVSASGTWEEFMSNCKTCIRMLFWMGLRSQQKNPIVTTDPKILQDSNQSSEGIPQPMLAITSLPHTAATRVINDTNQYLDDDKKIFISLVNGTHQVVASGPNRSLYGLNVALRKMKGAASADQSRVPFSKRKTPFTTTYLNSTVPFHSPYLSAVPSVVAGDFERLNLEFKPTDLKIPVLSTADGSDLRSNDNLTAVLTQQILSIPVDWPAVSKSMKSSHAIDFGPGGISGCGNLIRHNLEGTGAQVIIATSSSPSSMLPRSVIYDTVADVKRGVNWAEEFTPKLVRCTSTGQVHIDTKYSRVLGRPPIVVPGMTPTTISGDLISATLNAGFQIEISGGGHFNNPMLESKIKYIQERCKPGEGVSLNMLFLNQALWGIQFPHVQKMRKAGIPIEGVTVAAGVPSPDKAHEFLTAFKEAGIKHVSFKPGAEATIRQVIAIAESHPDMPIVMQWTGGRSGGHHSFEDQHEPILKTYGLCRRVPNLILVAGGGLGDAESTSRWLTGEWATKFDRPLMPFDGVLMGSRLMVAKEAETAPAVKQMIVDAPGITEEEEATWESTYTKPHGGILTVTSELGEPIHKIANRGVRFWKELDETIFNLPREKQLPAVLEKKAYIIERLNADAQKVYFPAKLTEDGQWKSVENLDELTYEEVARRLTHLLYDVGSAWIDPTLRNLTGKWLLRIEERFAGLKSTSTMLPDFSVINIPGPFLDTFFTTFSAARRQTLSVEDVDHYIALCAFPAQKPVPFIPRLDERFNTWFKKDSLWQSEKLEFVMGHDAERVNILHGPVAARYATKVDEPVADILGSIYEGQIEHLKQRGVQISDVESFGGILPKEVELGSNIAVERNEREAKFEITTDEEADLPEESVWLESISGEVASWLKALVCSDNIVRGSGQNSRWISNPVRRIIKPRLHQSATLSVEQSGMPLSLDIYRRGEKMVSISKSDTEENQIIVTLLSFSQYHEKKLPLDLIYRYHPECGTMPIREQTDGAVQRAKEFYSRLWLGDEDAEIAMNEPRPTWELTCLGENNPPHVITKSAITDFCQTVLNRNGKYVEGDKDGKLYAPLDYAMVAGWKSVIRALFAKNIEGDLLSLVHLGNSFRVLRPGLMLREGDELKSVGEVTSVRNDDNNNKIVDVTGTLFLKQEAVIEISSSFCYRGAGGDWENTFSRETHTPYLLDVSDSATAHVARSKTWIEWSKPDLVIEGAELTFNTASMRRFKASGGFSELTITGTVMVKLSTKEEVEIGIINFSRKDCAADPVASYLKRVATPVKDESMFETGRILDISEEILDASTRCPEANMPYSVVSGDTNPIHTNPYFADLAALPSTIVHGMWTSAAIRRIVEIFAADNHPHRVSYYKADFIGMVLPSDVLTTTLTHMGMTQGKKLIQLSVSNQNGVQIMKGISEVDEAPTAYIFTGQGSQTKGMGMDLYGSSEVAKAMWDRADFHLKHSYGFSILEIVRLNPNELTIHFGGKHGAVMRENYRRLVYEVQQKDGTMLALPLFPNITSTTMYHTFYSPKGLLNATQFTQPALTLMEVAAYKDMEEKGLVQQNAIFAGHSLGEYSSLAALAEVLSVEALVDVVFYRGMTMQVAVPRDSKGRSDYGMVAVNPSRVGEGFTQEALQFIVDKIKEISDEVLQIVNYNVVGQQYVASGELTTLDCLSNVLNFIKMEKLNVTKLLEKMSRDQLEQKLTEIAKGVYAKCVQKKENNGGRAISERGFATIPLPGIDVPFHSSFLLSGVAPFRELLKQKLSVDWVDVKALKARYIPNLVARPFDISKKFVEVVFESSKSPKIQTVLDNWKSDMNAAEQQSLGYILLIELLAYQFASPVRWIETQDVIFSDYGIERLVEIGPEPTLTTMASRTLKAKYEKHDDVSSFRRTILHVNKQKDELYYTADDSPAPAPAASKAAAAAPAPTPVAVVAAPAAAAPGPVSAVADAPVSAQEIVHVLVSTRIRKPLAETPTSKSIKDLVGGKSTLQNEILGDLGQEFPGFQMDKPEEEPLTKLSSGLTSTGTLGKVTQGLVTKMIGSKMPGGFGMGQVKSHLGSHGLATGRTDGCLLFGLTLEPSSRLGSEADAKKWLDTVASGYAAYAGITLGQPSAPAAVGAPVAVAAAAGPVSIPDAPVSAIDFIRVLVGTKMKLPANSDLDKRSIKELVSGKSTLQNELLGDLQAEFGDAITKIDGAAEMPLGEVAKALSTYSTLGKYSQKATQKLVSSKMPGSFGMTAVKSYLTSLGFGPQRTDGVLLFALSKEPAARLGSDADAKGFWDSVTSSYASVQGISLSGSGGAPGTVAVAGPAMSSAALSAITKKQDDLIREQMELFSTYLGEDSRAGWHAASAAKATISELQKELDTLKEELGDTFVDGITPKFSRKMARTYEASWNWAKQDYVQFLLDMTRGVIAPPTLSVAHQRMVHHIMNRADQQFFHFIEYYTKIAMARGGSYFQKLKLSGYMLAREIPTFAPVWMLDFAPAHHILTSPPLFTPVDHPMSPCTTISNNGIISYKEVPRVGVGSYVEYAKEMARGIDLVQLQQNAKVRKGLSKLQKLGSKNRINRKELDTILAELNLAGPHFGPAEVESEVDPDEAMMPKRDMRRKPASDPAPLLNLKVRSLEDPMHYEYNKNMTKAYLEALHSTTNSGITFKDKVALCTGCGRGSIGIEIIKILLSGGCKVICTTSSYSKPTCDFYRNVYEMNGAKGSSLNVVPFNGGSNTDIQAVVKFIYDDVKSGGLGTDLDFIIPFAAISEQGMEVDGIGSRSELAHRIMLTNVLRLLGAVKIQKVGIKQISRPTQVVLPMSPNHGIFGGDGLYAESKIGLEALFNKWHSEHWGKYLTIVGASIGWTRGTGLMAANNIVAEGIEKLGVRTFSTMEMALNISALMHPKIVKLAEREPVWADLNGGLHLVENLNNISSNLRTTIREIADVRSAVAAEQKREDEEISAVPVKHPAGVSARANLKFEFPKTKNYEKLHKELGHMKGMVDPAKVIVITGYGEVGPWGNSRTRWQIESEGQFSLEGCIEMAWAMGFITYKREPKYSGWVDAKSGKQLKDIDIKKDYEEEILKHAGVRIVEPELHDGYNPKKKMFLHQVSIDHEMTPVECGEDEAQAFKLQHGDSVDIWEKGDGIWLAKLRKGAQLYIPKALQFSRTVAGQIPTGWKAETYGLPKDIVDQVDPVTLFTLVSTVEALVTSGISDPYEFYKYIHVSELGNTSGGGIGGMTALQGIFRKRLLDQPVQKDILQESFINVMPAWVNLLLLSSSGPIKTPVGACATAVESVEIGVETIMSGKAKVVIAGGYDDFTEEGSYEFANMKATSDATEELLKGRTPSEMSRPTTTSRAGFMESQGAGMHVLMSAEVAIEMGVPIYGIVALTNTATDKEGRSVPAPGQGILTTARENRGIVPQRLLDFNWRKMQLKRERENIARWVREEHDYLQSEVTQLKEDQPKSGLDIEKYIDQRLMELKENAHRKEQAALETFGQSFYRNNASIAPMRGALAVWGLDVDDISVASFHGTSTQANDLNESEVVNTQVGHLGRSKGNLLPTVFQKWLTGHPKGAAAAWMLNGCLQMLEHQIIPGNRNADNVDSRLSKFSNLFFPSKTLRDVEVKACLLKSFGFGQVGGECLVIHPDYILATLDQAEYNTYMMKRGSRQQAAYKHYHESMTGGKLIRVKEAAPYTPEQQQSIYLDPLARASFKNGKWSFAAYTGPKQTISSTPQEERSMISSGFQGQKGIGCDVEMMSAIPLDNQTFIERNFTTAESDNCNASSNPRSAFTSLWCSKEAVIKAVSSFQEEGASPVWDGPAAPLREIEISADFKVTFHGSAAPAVAKAGVSKVSVSVSHSGAYCIAYAQAA